MAEDKDEGTATADDTYFCNTCSLEYPTQDDLEEHQWSLLHHKKLEKEEGRNFIHHCTLCKEDVFGLLSYTKHIHSDDHQKKLQKWKTRNAIVNDEDEGSTEPFEDMPPWFGPPPSQRSFGPRPNMPRNFRPFMPQRLQNRWHRPRFFPRNRPFPTLPFNRNPHPRYVPPHMFRPPSNYRFFDEDPFVARFQSNFRPQINPLMPQKAAKSDLSTDTIQRGIDSNPKESSFTSKDISSRSGLGGSHNSTENEGALPSRDFIPLTVTKDTASENKATNNAANSSIDVEIEDSSFQGFKATRIMRKKMKELKAKMSKKSDQNIEMGAKFLQSDTASTKGLLLNIGKESMSNTDDLAIEVPGSFEILSRESEKLEANEQRGSGDKGQESLNKSEFGKKLETPFVGSKEEESLAHFVTENLWNKKDDLELDQDSLSDLEENTQTSNVVSDKCKVRIAREGKRSDKEVRIVSVKNMPAAVQSAKMISDVRNLRLSNNGADKSKSKVRKVDLSSSQTAKKGNPRSDVFVEKSKHRVEGSKSDFAVSVSEKKRDMVHSRSEERGAVGQATQQFMRMLEAGSAGRMKERSSKQQNDQPHKKNMDNNDQTSGNISHNNIGAKNHRGTKGNSSTACMADVCTSDDVANLLSRSVHDEGVRPKEAVVTEMELESTRRMNASIKKSRTFEDANAGTTTSKNIPSTTPSSTNEPHSSSNVSLESSIVSLDESLLSSNSTNQCEFRYQDGRRCPTSAEHKFCSYHEEIVRNVFIHLARAPPRTDPTSSTASTNNEQRNDNVIAASDSDVDVDHVRLQSRFKYINKVPSNPIRGVDRTHLPPNIRKLLNKKYEAGKLPDEPHARESERDKEMQSREDDLVPVGEKVSEPDPVIDHGNQGSQRLPAEGKTGKNTGPQNEANLSGTESVVIPGPLSRSNHARYTTNASTNILEKQTSNSASLRHADSVRDNNLGSAVTLHSKLQTVSQSSSRTVGKEDDLSKVTEGSVLQTATDTMMQAVLSGSVGNGSLKTQTEPGQAPAASKEANVKSISDLRSEEKRSVVKSASLTRPASSDCAGSGESLILSRPRLSSTGPSPASVGSVKTVAKASTAGSSEHKSVSNKIAVFAAAKPVEVPTSKPKSAASTVSSTAVVQSSTGKKVGEAESRNLAKSSKPKSNLVDMRTLANLVLSSTIPAAESAVSGRPEGSGSTNATVASKARSNSVGSASSPLDKGSNSITVPQRPTVAKELASSMQEKYQRRRSVSFDLAQPKHVNVGLSLQPDTNAKTVSVQNAVKKVAVTKSPVPSSDETVNKSKAAEETSRPTNSIADTSSSTAARSMLSSKVGGHIPKATEITTNESGDKTQAATLSNFKASKSTNVPVSTSVLTASIPKTSSSALLDSSAATSVKSTSTLSEERVSGMITTTCQSESEAKPIESIDVPRTSSSGDLSQQRNLLRNFFDNLRKKKQAQKLSATVPAGTENKEFSGGQSESQSQLHLVDSRSATGASTELARSTKAIVQPKEIEASQHTKSGDVVKKLSSEYWKQGSTVAIVNEGGPKSINKRSIKMPLVSDEESHENKKGKRKKGDENQVASKRRRLEEQSKFEEFQCLEKRGIATRKKMSKTLGQISKCRDEIETLQRKLNRLSKRANKLGDILGDNFEKRIAVLTALGQAGEDVAVHLKRTREGKVILESLKAAVSGDGSKTLENEDASFDTHEVAPDDSKYSKDLTNDIVGSELDIGNCIEGKYHDAEGVQSSIDNHSSDQEIFKSNSTQGMTMDFVGSKNNVGSGSKTKSHGAPGARNDTINCKGDKLVSKGYVPHGTFVHSVRSKSGISGGDKSNSHGAHGILDDSNSSISDQLTDISHSFRDTDSYTSRNEKGSVDTDTSLCLDVSLNSKDSQLQGQAVDVLRTKSKQSFKSDWVRGKKRSEEFSRKELDLNKGAKEKRFKAMPHQRDPFRFESEDDNCSFGVFTSSMRYKKLNKDYYVKDKKTGRRKRKRPTEKKQNDGSGTSMSSFVCMNKNVNDQALAKSSSSIEEVDLSPRVKLVDIRPLIEKINDSRETHSPKLKNGSENVIARQGPMAFFKPPGEREASIDNFESSAGRQSIWEDTNQSGRKDTNGKEGKQSLTDRFKHPTDASKLEQYENFLKLQKQLDIDLNIANSSWNRTSNKQSQSNEYGRKEQLLEGARDRLLSMNNRETSDAATAAPWQGMNPESGASRLHESISRKRSISTDSSKSSSRSSTTDADGISFFMNRKLKNARKKFLMDNVISPKFYASIVASELVFEAHKGSVTCIQVYRGFLYTSSQDKSIRIHDTKTAIRLKVDINNKKVINRIEIDRKGVNSTLFAGCNDNKVKYYNLYTLCLDGEILFEGRVLALHVAFENLYVGLSHGEVSIVSLKTKRVSASFYCGDGDDNRKAISCITSANFSSEGKSYNWIIVGTFNSTITIYDPYQCITVCGCLCAKKFINHDSPVLCMEVLHDRLYSGSTTGNVLVHDLKELRYLDLFCHQNGAIMAIKVFGKLLVTASTDKLVRCYDIHKGTIVKVYGGHKATVYCLASDREGARIYSGSKDGDVRSNKLQLEPQAKCQWKGCGLPFGLTSHLKPHILSHHISRNTSSFTCKWKSCSHVYPNRIKGKYLEVDEEHVEHHVREPSS